LTRYDYIIIGAGIYGAYASLLLGKKGMRIAVIEVETQPLQRASFINQARVHNGYHYPRSVSTALKSSQYYKRFNKDFGFAINKKFKKIYAISKYDSLTNSTQFSNFCRQVDIPAEEINPNKFFIEGFVEAAFETDEFTYDAHLIRKWYLEEVNKLKNVTLYLQTAIHSVCQNDGDFNVKLQNGEHISSSIVINATYASINQIHELFNVPAFKTKYELCEVILIKPGRRLSDIGITLMDGPFFSIMPFGMTGYHSLTSVSFTPHETSISELPSFSCQSLRGDCSIQLLQNCNNCSVRPVTEWANIQQQVRKYLKSEYDFSYEYSLFTVKTLLNSSEIDDSRPTVIRSLTNHPTFISVLSGKFNTIYDLEEILL